MKKNLSKDIVEALEGLNHEVLAHGVFQKCISKAIEDGSFTPLKRTSLFRTALAYFLMVPEAPEKFLKELQAATPTGEQ